MELSIIMPVYNGEEYIRESIESAMAQTVEEKELICIDDGSTDHSAEIITELQKKYPDRIRLLSQHNQGAAVARNYGLSVAQGEYIVFLDADDYYYSAESLRCLIDACKGMNVPICAGFELFDRGGKCTQNPMYRDIFSADEEAKIVHYREFQFLYYYQSYVFQRDFLKKYSLTFPLLRRYQDPPFLAKALSIADTYGVIAKDIYCYRLRMKPMKFSPIQIHDILCGIELNIQLAKEGNYEILLKRCIKCLNEEFYTYIKEDIKNHDVEAIFLLHKIDEMLCDSGYRNAIKAYENIFSTFAHNESWIYQFPYEFIPAKASIILYGAGKVGKCLYRQLQYSHYAHVSLWVDKNWKELAENHFFIQSPEAIKDDDSKYILIAIEKREIYDEIVEEIKSHDWNKSKKLIGPVEKAISSI